MADRFAADYVQTATANLSSVGSAEEDGCSERSDIEPQISQIAQMNAPSDHEVMDNHVRERLGDG